MISKALQGDRSAYGELVSCYHQGVINVVYRMCADQRLAEDAAQEAFIKGWLKLDSYRPGSSYRNWIYRIAVNTALDMLRKRSSQPHQDIEEVILEGDEYQPEALFMQDERARIVQKAVQSLPISSRTVLVLREYEGLSYQEIANWLDIPMGTVMSRLNYARNCLRTTLKEALYKMEVDYV